MKGKTINFLIDDPSGVSFEGHVEAFQDLINTGDAWRLEGAVGREAMALIDQGRCMLGETGHRDYWGNYVPSRYEVQPGTKGSREYVEAST